MSSLGNPEGIFDLNQSDRFVGSYLRESDLAFGLSAKQETLNDPKIASKFTTIDGIDVADEREIWKAWKHRELPGELPLGKHDTFDELMLQAILRKTYTFAKVTRQVRMGKFKMDLLVEVDDCRKFIEFDGPSHFKRIGQYGPPSITRFTKKDALKKCNVKSKATKSKSSTGRTNPYKTETDWVRSGVPRNTSATSTSPISRNSTKDVRAIWSMVE